MADEEETKEYRWETGYEKTWEAIKEDDDGLIDTSASESALRAARRRAAAARKGPVRLGMMRHLIISIDCSEAMSSQDLKPTRFLCTLKLLENFIEEYFDQNPLSQLGILALKNKRIDRITDLSGNYRKHLKAIQGMKDMPLSGEPSLQNALEISGRSLRSLPSHTSREILILSASLTTCDPGDINVTIQNLKTEGVRISVIGLAAEVRICKQMCLETGGEYGVVMDDVHLRSLLLGQTVPPVRVRARALDASLVKMGFPHGAKDSRQLQEGSDPPMTVCMCHIDDPDMELTDSNMSSDQSGHLCPQCRSKYCELPAQCRTCDLTLASAPHLARSYHHLFPVNAYKEYPNDGKIEHCFACLKMFTKETDKLVYKCDICTHYFCSDCEIMVHESLHTCPGCASNPQTFQRLVEQPQNGSPAVS